MNLSTIFRLFVILLFLLFFPLEARSEVSNELGLWNAIKIKLPITEKFESRFQISPRLTDEITDFNQLILHSLIGYKFNDHFSIWQGYAWSTFYVPGFRNENRIYNDISYNRQLGKLGLELRFRLEERFISTVDEVSIRNRYRIKTVIPIKNIFDFVLYDEFFVNFNDADSGPQAGLDHNRLYAGIRKKISQNTTLETGYLMQYVFSGADRIIHNIYGGIDIELPALFKKI